MSASSASARPDRALRRTTVLWLFPSVLLVGAPATVMAAAGTSPGNDVRTALAIVAALPLITPLLLRAAGRRWDPLLLSPAWVLCALGLAVIARVQPQLLDTQLLWITLGWAAFIALAGFPPLLDWLRRYRYTGLTAALLLTVSTFFLADDLGGRETRLWLRVGPVTVQPAEILRVLLIAFLAAYLAERREMLMATWRRVGPIELPSPAYWAPLLGMAGLSMLVVVAQRDLGPTLIFGGSFLAMLYLSTGRRDHTLIAAGMFVAGGLLAYAASPRVQDRVVAWLDPWSDPQGVGYQALQALGGFAFGGVTGAGPGYGYPGLIPAAHTDYPLAVIGEEWGLIGTLAVVLLYGLFIVRALARARTAESRFAQLLGAGLAVSVAVQVLVVSAGVLRLLPLTGITSPFLSYGGSSMVMSWVILALLVRAGAPAGSSAAPELPSFASLPGLATRTRHVGLAVLAGFVVLAGGLGYWQVLRAEALVADPAVAGERLRLEAARITRGRILDRNGEVLAETVMGPGGLPERRYRELSAVHVVGFDLPRLGALGAEAAAADELMGRGGRATPLDTWRDLMRRPRAGADVRLTLDAALQRVTADAMGDAMGAAIAIDPQNGDILALVSNPGYRPDITQEEWEELRRDERSPLLNRATQGLYTPGSTFKTVTLAAAIQSGFRPDDPAECHERAVFGGLPITSRNEPPSGPGTRTLADAYAYSCNTYFADLGLQVGADGMRSMAEAMGLLQHVPLALPTSRGTLSHSDEFLSDDVGLAVTAFGQGELQLTPLHLALVVAAIANEGAMPEPRIFVDDAPSTWRLAMRPEDARTVAAVMEHSVNVGWASVAQIPGVRVGGKSGSAEVADGGQTHALFVAFAPVDDPQIAVVVVKEHAGSGSAQSGPVARAMIEAWLSR